MSMRAILVMIILTALSAGAAGPDAVSGATKKAGWRSNQTSTASVEKPYAVSPAGGEPEVFKGRQAAITFVDQPLLKAYGELDIHPAQTCSDSVFIRRVFLDLTGSIPTAEQARSFIETKSLKKRAEVIDYLLQSDAFYNYTAMLWCDRLRVKSEFPINLWPNAVQAYHHWILESIRENKPYDQFVREILTSNGSNFRVPPVNFFRAVQSNDPESLAGAVALTFMGCRLDTWPEDQQKRLAEFFSDIHYNQTGEWKEEIVYADLFSLSTNRRPEQLTLPEGVSVNVTLNQDARVAFSDWLIAPANPWFARNAVNRIWYQLFGAGIVNEPDDFRPDNPPVNEELLALLAKELVESKYDLRHIYRIILNSATYQRSSVPETNTPEAERLFANYPLRRLDAETLIDALCSITGTTEQYWSVIPEPFSFMPVEDGSVSLADGSITSPFLEKFGRPPRDTGLAAERNNEVTAAQMLHLLNSSHVRNKLEGRTPQPGFIGGRRGRQMPARGVGSDIQELYYRILSRPPTDEELRVIGDYAQNAEAKGTYVGIDVVWALINSPEFLFKH